MRQPIYPLAEEIGDPDLFVGRKKEMACLLAWAEDTKWLRPGPRRHHPSI